MQDASSNNDVGQEFLAHMMQLWIKICRNRDKVDLIAAGNNTYQKYWSSLQNQQRFQSPGMAKMGFSSLKFDNADVILDGGVGGSLGANLMYFLNCDYLRWRPHKDSNMRPGMNRYAVNQDALVKLILWAGNLTVSNMMLQGRLSQ